jgi:protein-S-isoprenylcysteine O-methyltransferase Ste14
MTKAVAGLAFLLGVLAAALFGPPWTLDYWQAWVFLGVFASMTTAITIDLGRRDPALLARRTKAGPTAEPTRAQQIIQSLASLAFVAIFVIAGLDRRWGWSRVPGALVVTGDALVALGLGVVGWVFRANTYASAVIDVEREQQIVTTGPYAIVRHSLYAGATVMLVGVPLALGSWFAAGAVVALVAVIVVRLLDEERTLVASLPGYPAYRATVTRRLVPYVW